MAGKYHLIHMITPFSSLGLFFQVTYNVNEMTLWDEMRTSALSKLSMEGLTHILLTFTSFSICNQSLLSQEHMLYSCTVSKTQQVLDLISRIHPTTVYNNKANNKFFLKK
jgi:hypothetical protein